MKPKVKTNKSKTGKRRSHHALKLPVITKCKSCGSSKRPHYACPKCE